MNVQKFAMYFRKKQIVYDSMQVIRFFSQNKLVHKKLYPTGLEAVRDIENGAKVLVGGYGMCGVPENLISALLESGAKDLEVCCYLSGADNFGVTKLLIKNRVSRIITSYMGGNEEFEAKFFAGKLEVEFTPQGSLAERIRAGGAGIPAFYTPAGYGTLVHEGGAPMKYTETGKVLISSKEKSEAIIQGQKCILEEAIKGDYALVKAWKADPSGNLLFRQCDRNVNVVMSKAARITIAEVEEIVPLGAIEPDHVHLPGIFIDRIVVVKNHEKKIEQPTLQRKPKTLSAGNSSPAAAIRERIIRRAALELKDGMYVNLGFGLPMLIRNFIPEGMNICVHSNIGMLRQGPFPASQYEDHPEIINGSQHTVTVHPGASFFSCDDSFAMIRGGHIDLAIVSAMEVSEFGDLADAMIPAKTFKGIGGMMDLVAAQGTKVVVAMEHTTKAGLHKIVRECSLPLIGKNCVNLIVTEKCVFEVSKTHGLILTEIAEGTSLVDVIQYTGCDFEVSPKLKPMGRVKLNDEE